MVFFKYLFIFCLFSVVGWILELIYRSIVTNKLVNPGFMSGCVVPLYGFGAVIMTFICNLFLSIKSDYKIMGIFLIAIILLSLLEFISGYILLKFFHLKLWDYSMYKYNYKGFICIKFSLIWGILALIFYLFVYPWLNSLAVGFVGNTYGLFFLGIFMGIFIIDLCVSIQLLNRLTKYSILIKEIIDVEKLKREVLRNLNRNKFFNNVYPYISTNKFLRDKIKDSNIKKEK